MLDKPQRLALAQLAAQIAEHPDFPRGSYEGAPYLNTHGERPYIAARRTGLGRYADVLLIVDPEQVPLLEADLATRKAALANALHTARRKCGLLKET